MFEKDIKLPIALEKYFRNTYYWGSNFNASPFNGKYNRIWKISLYKYNYCITVYKLSPDLLSLF